MFETVTCKVQKSNLYEAQLMILMLEILQLVFWAVRGSLFRKMIE